MTQAVMAEIERRVARDQDSGQVELTIGQVPVVELFYSLGTQWVRAGLAGAEIALNYAVIKPVAEILGIDLTPKVFADLRTMESAAIAEMARRRR